MQILVPAAFATLIAVMAGSVTMAASSRPPASAHASGTTWATRTTTVTGTAPPGGRPPTTSATTAATVTGTTAPDGRPPAPTPATRVSTRRGLAWPLSPRPTVRRRFEQPRSQWSAGHRGVDLLATVGQPVLSAGDGVIAFSGVIAGRGVISVRHPGGLRTSYEPVDGRVPSGTLVHRGTPIGVVSPAPGHCAPLTCLHWGAIYGRTYRDPLSLLGLGRPILLPLG